MIAPQHWGTNTLDVFTKSLRTRIATGYPNCKQVKLQMYVNESDDFGILTFFKVYFLCSYFRCIWDHNFWL